MKGQLNAVTLVGLASLISVLQPSGLARAAAVTLNPDPLVGGAFQVTGGGSFDGSTTILDFNLDGVTTGNATVWGFMFDGIGFDPLSASADSGSPGLSLSPPTPGFFAFEAGQTAGGLASFQLNFLPSTFTVFFDNGVDSSTASGSLEASETPPQPPTGFPVDLMPEPIGVSGIWSVTGDGRFDGTATTIDLSLVGLFFGDPVIWSVQFDEIGIDPFAVLPARGSHAPLSPHLPGAFALLDAGSATASFQMNFLPNTMAVSFSNDGETFTTRSTNIVAAVSEPGTLVLFVLGLAGLGFARRQAVLSTPGSRLG